jgi:hypothetical protein
MLEQPYSKHGICGRTSLKAATLKSDGDWSTIHTQVKLSLHTTWGICREVELHLFLTPTLSGYERLASQPNHFTPETQFPVPTVEEAWWAPEPVWTFWRKSSSPSRIRTLDSPSLSQVTVLITLSLQSDPWPQQHKRVLHCDKNKRVSAVVEHIKITIQVKCRKKLRKTQCCIGQWRVRCIEQCNGIWVHVKAL